jgi:hypothetical protein
MNLTEALAAGYKFHPANKPGPAVGQSVRLRHAEDKTLSIVVKIEHDEHLQAIQGAK